MDRPRARRRQNVQLCRRQADRSGGKRILLTIARGGFYGSESPIASFERTETYLKTAFAFIGLNAEAIVAEGIAVGPDQRAAAVEAAQAQIAALHA